MKKFISLAITTLMSLNVFAVDVGSRSGNLLLKVTVSQDKKSVNFQECQILAHTCRNLGSKKFYSLKELRDQRANECWQIAGSTAADVGILAAFILTGGILGGAAGSGYVAVGATFSSTSIAGMTLGAASGAGVSTAVDALNPYEQYKQYDSVNENIITDKFVRVETDEDVMDIIDSLEVVLEKFSVEE